MPFSDEDMVGVGGRGLDEGMEGLPEVGCQFGEVDIGITISGRSDRGGIFLLTHALILAIAVLDEEEVFIFTNEVDEMREGDGESVFTM